MHAPRWERFAAICGVLFVVLAVAGFALVDAGLPSSDAPREEVVEYFEESGTELKRELGANLAAAGAFFLLVFVGRLRSALREAEGAGGTFASVAFGGGVAMASLLLVGGLVDAGVASADGFFGSYEVDADTAILLMSVSWWVSGFLLLAGGVMVGATSVVALKTGFLPRWLAIAGLVLAVASIANETTQALVIPLLLVLVWIAIVSVILTRRGPGRTQAET
jgi:hypothetical protein